MKDFIEPFLYPHNLFLWAFLIAAIRYRRWGLWLLLGWFYAFGNGYVANQVRFWYSQQISSEQRDPAFAGNYVVLGCGGTADNLPDCAKSRLDQLLQLAAGREDYFIVHITTLYCQPYLDHLKQALPKTAQLDCFHGGATTYHEFYNLSTRLNEKVPLSIVSSDYHAFRVKKLAEEYGFKANVYAAQSSTFRPVQCRASCFLTVNLSNYDLFAKLTAEMSSFYSYQLTKRWTSWYKTEG